MERSDTPEKIENDRKPMKPLMLIPRHEASESVCVQVLKIALEAVKSRINRRDQRHGSPPTGWWDGWMEIKQKTPDWLGDLSHDWRFWTLTHYLMAIPTISNHSMGSFAIEEFWTLSYMAIGFAQNPHVRQPKTSPILSCGCVFSPLKWMCFFQVQSQSRRENRHH